MIQSSLVTTQMKFSLLFASWPRPLLRKTSVLWITSWALRFLGQNTAYFCHKQSMELIYYESSKWMVRNHIHLQWLVQQIESIGWRSAIPDPSVYPSAVGALLYLTWIRPNIAFAVNQVCQFMYNPTTAHWTASESFGILKALSPWSHLPQVFKLGIDVFFKCRLDWHSRWSQVHYRTMCFSWQ